MSKAPIYDGRFTLVHDGLGNVTEDSEWYVIPVSRLTDWKRLVSSTKDEDLPAYAYHVGKSVDKVTFADWRIERV